MLTLSFSIFMLGFLAVGMLSFTQSRKSQHDYYMASRSVSPFLVGLSAVATNNSGYMFIGVIGYTYATGLASVWLMLGWLCGDFLSSLFIHKRLRHATERIDAVSYADIIANWDGKQRPMVRRLAGLISLIFLLTYAAAQLLAGSKALMVLLEWPHYAGAIMGAVMVGLYCLAGGIRASIWTDAAQSVVMILAMGLLLYVSIDTLGGWSEANLQLGTVEGFMDWAPEDLAFPGVAGVIAFAVSWLFAGASVIGQPHVMIRFMTLDTNKHFNSARAWYYIWFTLFYCAATAVGLLSRVLLPETGSFDAELALPMMASQMLPELLVGLILAGIFAATMSTADSLILACSAAISHDLVNKPMVRQWQIKGATLLITLLALTIALCFETSVFSLVLLSWSTLASAFAPMLILWVLGCRPNQQQSVLVICCGVMVCLLWRHFGLQQFIYEGMPGIVAGLVCYPLFGVLANRQRRSAQVES